LTCNPCDDNSMTRAEERSELKKRSACNGHQPPPSPNQPFLFAWIISTFYFWHLYFGYAIFDLTTKSSAELFSQRLAVSWKRSYDGYCGKPMLWGINMRFPHICSTITIILVIYCGKQCLGLFLHLFYFNRRSTYVS
jgi:hypothetical protein